MNLNGFGNIREKGTHSMAVRILSALVGIVIGVLIMAIDKMWLYIAAIAFLSAVGVWEITKAVNCGEFLFLRWSCIVFSVVSVPLIVLELKFDLSDVSAIVYTVFIMLLFLIMLTRHTVIRFEHIAMCGVSAIVIPASLSCLILLRYSMEGQALGIFMLLYLLFCAWFADGGAYFVGTFIGKHKLCPKVSPKKTVEGFIGGIITVGVVVAIQCATFNAFVLDGVRVSYAVLVPVGMIASLAGVLGDLSASVIKREFKVKDFGNIMPGHGGVLDRFDSVLFVAPFLYILFRYINPVITL